MRRREFVTLLGSAIAAIPALARAQQAGKIPTVGHLWHAGSAVEEEPYFITLREGFAKLGYIDGRNFKLIHRFPNEVPENFRVMAAELVAMNVDVLMGGGIGAPYLKQATSTIPIVFMFIADPVGIQLVQKLLQDPAAMQRGFRISDATSQASVYRFSRSSCQDSPRRISRQFESAGYKDVCRRDEGRR